MGVDTSVAMHLYHLPLGLVKEITHSFGRFQRRKRIGGVEVVNGAITVINKKTDNTV